MKLLNMGVMAISSLHPPSRFVESVFPSDMMILQAAVQEEIDVAGMIHISLEGIYPQS